MEFKALLINDILFHSINNSWVGGIALCWHMYNVEQTLKYYGWLTRMTLTMDNKQIRNILYKLYSSVLVTFLMGLVFVSDLISHPYKKQAKL